MIIKNQEGATVVEFALIAPLLILLTFGIIEFGLFLFNTQAQTNENFSEKWTLADGSKSDFFG